MTLGSSSKARLLGDERVEGRVAQQVECERHPVGGCATGVASRGDGADLARADAEPADVERPTQREADLRVAVPTEVDDGALGREQVERQLEPGGRRAGVYHQVAAVGGAGRKREVCADGRCDAGPAGVDVHERDLDGRDPAQQPCDAAADHPGADDRDPVADQRGGVPEGVDGGFDGAREHGAGGGTSSGTTDTALDGTT